MSDQMDSMPDQMDRETVWKDLLTNDTEKAVGYIYPDIHADIDWRQDPESLEQEFRKGAPDMIAGKRVVDKLLKLVQRKTGEPRYLHFEIQAYWEALFEYRVYYYNSYAEIRFGQPVVSLPLLIDIDNPRWIPRSYKAELYGTRRTLSFRSIKLLNYRKKLKKLEADTNPMALFVLAWLKGRELGDNLDSLLLEKVRLIQRLKGAGLELDVTNRWLGYFDWLMWLPTEYNARLRELLEASGKEKRMATTTVPGGGFREYLIEMSLEEGRKEGREEGIEKGEVIGQIRMSQEWLRVPQTPRDELAKLDLAELQRRLDELRANLPLHSNGTQPNP